VSGAAGSAARRVGVAPEALALLAGRRRQADARVVDLTQFVLGGLLFGRSIDFGGAAALLEVFSTMPEVGRALSSCLRNGLRMMGIVTNLLLYCCPRSGIRKGC